MFKDSWIPGCFPTKAAPLMQECDADSRVTSLIDQETMEWNEQLIDQNIAPYLAQRIKAIPFFKMPQTDCIVWPRSRDGNYSVKIGYQLLGELENRVEASGSDNSGVRNFWKWLWSLRIPNKIKHFDWCACTDSLPTMANLHRRKVVDSPFCSNCDRARETVCHAIWECDKVLDCWGHGFKTLRSLDRGLGSFADLVFSARQQEENVELFIVVAWLIWNRRNKIHFNEQHMPPEKILEAVVALLTEFHGNSVERSKKKVVRTHRWAPPVAGVYKVNYDGAYFADEEKAGIRVMVRNELGQVMGSLAEKIEMPATVEILEAMVARRAMLFMEELGLRYAVFEGDSELVVNALVGHCPDRASIGHIIKDCKSLRGLFQTYSFSHVRRQGNGVAHALARRARMSFPLTVWMESVPPDITYLVYVDVTS